MQFNYDYDYNYNSSNAGYARIGDVGSLVESIKPNVNASHNSAKAKRNLFAVLIPVCMILFMGGFSLAFEIKEPFDPPNFAFLLFGILGFIGFPICGVLMGFFSIKAAKFQIIITLKNEIEAHEKTKLDDLSLSGYIGKNSVVLVINKLIKTGNLVGYEVIGNVGVAKTELRAKERDFVTPSTGGYTAPVENTRRFKCPNCGAAITEKTGKFCTFCGTRLE